MTYESAPIELPNASEGERGIDLLSIFVSLVSEWRLIVSWAIALFVLFCLIIFTLKPKFVATAKILPTGTREQNDALASLFGSRGAGALYVGLLESRSVMDDVLDRTGLMQAEHARDRWGARGILADKTTITEGADTLISIEVKDVDAKRAAEIANAYLDSLHALNNRLRVTESAETRQFFQTQLQEERGLLSSAETALTRTQKQTGVVDPAAQTQLGLAAIQGIRNQITALEVSLAGLLQRETEQAPDVQALRSQIAKLQSQEHEMESSASGPVGAAPAAGRMPENNLDYERAQRDVRQHELVVQSLANQYEAARLMESRGRSAFQIVDFAVAPERKAWPPRRPLVILAFVFAWIIGLSAAVVKRMFGRLTADPASQANLARLRAIFGKS